MKREGARFELRWRGTLAGNKEQPMSPSRLLSKRWNPDRAPVLVVGDSMLDVYVTGSVDRISPEAPVPVIRQAQTSEAVGGAANVAVNIASLGGAAHLISCIGADSDGARIASMLTAAGVTFNLIRTETRPTTVKTRFLAGQHQLLRLDKENSEAVSPDCEEDILCALTETVERCAAIVVSDYNKGMLTDHVLSKTIALGRSRGIPIVVDPKRRDLSIYFGATLIKPNLVELEASTGLYARSDADVERAAMRVAAATGASILVTRSEAGMSLILADGTSIHMPTQAKEVFDVTGAGDTVIAALAVTIASGRSFEEAMAFCNIAGGIAVSKCGTAVVSGAEIEAQRALIEGDHSKSSAELATLDDAERVRNLWKKQGLAVGFTSGCFDLLHPGHVSLLREAAKSCDRLIVGLNSDTSVRRLKGQGRPIQDARARAAVLCAIEHVDLVVLFEEDTPIQLIQRLLPDVLIEGADYRIEDIVGHDIVAAAGGSVITVELVPHQSTTRLIKLVCPTIEAK